MTFTLQDYIDTLHRDVPQWYGWAKADGYRGVYENLIIHNDSITKPTEQECIDGVAALQSEWDAQEYARDRVDAYPDMQEQFDLLYHELETSGSLTTSGSWFNTVKAVKDANPKG